MRKLEGKCHFHKALNSAKQGSCYGSISLLEEGTDTPLWLPGATGQCWETRGRVGPCCWFLSTRVLWCIYVLTRVLACKENNKVWTTLNSILCWVCEEKWEPLCMGWSLSSATYQVCDLSKKHYLSVPQLLHLQNKTSNSTHVISSCVDHMKPLQQCLTQN